MLTSNAFSTLGFVSFLSLGLVACGSGDDPDEDPENSLKTHTQFVLDTLSVPTSVASANSFAQDLNDDGLLDNALGGVLGSLANLNLQAGIDSQIATAGISLLMSIESSSLDTANDANAYLFFGENPAPAACSDPNDLSTCGQHLTGGASFELAPTSPSDSVVNGGIADGNFSGGPGTLSIQLPVGTGAPIKINLIAAHLTSEISTDGLMSGKLGGAISKSEIESQLLPAVHSLVLATIAESCTGQGEDCGCELGSTGAVVRNLFDSDQNCDIPLEEFSQNGLIAATILNPDLDLLDADGNYAPSSDGKDDSLSLGIGFTGVKASFPLPGDAE